MKILVTGSAGFIGSHLKEACEKHWPQATVHGFDVVHGWDCRQLFTSSTRYDLVFHCAAITGGIVGVTTRPGFTGSMNAQLDGALFEWALRTKPGRVVYISSSCVYPIEQQHSESQGPLAEELVDLTRHRGTPEATYGWVKLLGEILAGSVRDAGVPVSIVRPFAVYGSEQETTHVVPAFAERARRHDSPFTVWGPGTQTCDFVHVEDCVGAILAVTDAAVDGPVNIGTGIGTTMDEVAHLSMQAARYEAPIVHDLTKPTGVQYRVADATLMRSIYEPKVTIAEGVRRAVTAVPLSYARGDDVA